MTKEYRVAGALIKLRDQINAAYPKRNKASDGTIGDAAHAADTTSDHNPNADGVVCALDITHDPANGVDIDKLSDLLVDSRDPRIKYLIANGLILVPADYGWTWIEYDGVDPHTNHIHISVYGDYDNMKEWNIGDNMKLTAVIINYIWRGFFDTEPPKKEVEYWTGRSDVTEFEKYLASLYQQNEGRRWKANNYDKDIKAASSDQYKLINTPVYTKEIK